MLFLCKAILHSYHPDWQANSIACAAWDPYLFLEFLNNCVKSLNLGKLFSWLSFLCHVMISWEHLAWWLLPHQLEDILCNCGTSSMLCSKSRAPTRRSPMMPNLLFWGKFAKNNLWRLMGKEEGDKESLLLVFEWHLHQVGVSLRSLYEPITGVQLVLDLLAFRVHHGCKSRKED